MKTYANKQKIEQLVSTFNMSIGCYDAAVEGLDNENLKKVMYMLDYGCTDVDVQIKGKPYVIEIVHTDNEIDLYLLSKADYISRYGDGRYLPE